MSDLPILTGTAHTKEMGLYRMCIPEVEIMGLSWNSAHSSHYYEIFIPVCLMYVSTFQFLEIGHHFLLYTFIQVLVPIVCQVVF